MSEGSPLPTRGGHLLSSVKRALTRRRRAATVAVTALLVTGAGLTFAPSASADAFRCPSGFGSDSQPMRAYVDVSSGTLTVRSGPGTTHAAVGSLSDGTLVEVDCWDYGTSVNGYDIWTDLHSAGGDRWVSDYYLTTGRVQNFIRQC